MTPEDKARQWDLNAAKNAEIKRLREALRPFAAIKPSALFANDEQCGYRVIIEPVGTAEFTNADLTRARAALATIDKAIGGEG